MKCFILKTQDDLSYELIFEADLLPVTAEAQHPHVSKHVGQLHTALEAVPCRHSFMLPTEASPCGSQKLPLLAFYTVCSLEMMNVNTYCGHLLSVPVRLILPKPYANLGRR